MSSIKTINLHTKDPSGNIVSVLPAGELQRKIALLDSTKFSAFGGTINGDVTITGSLSVGGVVGGLPVGSIIPYGGASSSTIPAGFLPCDGRLLSRDAFPSLFSVIGETYGAGDGTSTFEIPYISGAPQHIIKTFDTIINDAPMPMASAISAVNDAASKWEGAYTIVDEFMTSGATVGESSFMGNKATGLVRFTKPQIQIAWGSISVPKVAANVGTYNAAIAFAKPFLNENSFSLTLTPGDDPGNSMYLRINRVWRMSSAYVMVYFFTTVDLASANGTYSYTAIGAW